MGWCERVSDQTLARIRPRTEETVAATNTSALTPSDTLDTKRPPTDLREVTRDLMSIEDQEAASRRLAEKLVSFS
jgi:hypothetical protein